MDLMMYYSAQLSQHKSYPSKIPGVITDPDAWDVNILNLNEYLHDAAKVYTLCRITFAFITTDQTSGLIPKVGRLKNINFSAERTKFNATPLLTLIGLETARP